MFGIRLLKLASRFSKILQLEQQQIYKKFVQNPKLKIFDPYTSMQSLGKSPTIQMSDEEKLGSLNQMLQQLKSIKTPQKSDMELYLKSNVHRLKSSVHYQKNQQLLALSQIQLALSAMTQISNPHHFETATFFVYGSICASRCREYQKDLNFLKNAQHYLTNANMEVEQDKKLTQQQKNKKLLIHNYVKISILLRYCGVHSQLRNYRSVGKYVDTAIVMWKNIQNKNHILFYETMRIKSLDFLLRKQHENAMLISKGVLLDQKVNIKSQNFMYKMWFIKVIIAVDEDQTYTKQYNKLLGQIKQVLKQQEIKQLKMRLQIIDKITNFNKAHKTQDESFTNDDIPKDILNEDLPKNIREDLQLLNKSRK